MVFLNFFFDSDKEGHWLPPIERPIAGVGSITSITPAIASAALLVLATFVSPEMKEDVLFAGLAGLVVYLVVSGVAERLEPDDDEDEEEEEAAAAAAADRLRHRAERRPGRGRGRRRDARRAASPTSSTSRCSTRRSASTA